jgi:hypothetical protein
VRHEIPAGHYRAGSAGGAGSSTHGGSVMKAFGIICIAYILIALLQEWRDKGGLAALSLLKRLFIEFSIAVLVIVMLICIYSVWAS